MMKKSLSLILILIMALAFGVCAEDVATTETADNTAKVVLSATEPDENGYFTMTLTAYNFEFLGMQSYITYDKEAVLPVSAETKEETEEFKAFALMPAVAEKDGKEITEVFMTTWTNILKDDGAFSFAIFPELKNYPNSIVNENKRIVANNDGLVIFKFHFKKISDKDADFKVYNSTRSTEQDGIKISNVVEKNYTITTEVLLPEAVSKIEVPAVNYEVKIATITSDDSADADTSMEQRVKVRSRNVIFLNIGNYAAVSDSKLKWIDKDNKEVKPYIKDDRTMVPLRFLAEEMGATVGYNEESKAITITLGETVMELVVDEKAYTLNGEAKEMDCSAEIVENRTFVPVRFVSEALGKAVEWLANERMVVVTNTNYPWAKDNGVEKALLSEIQLMVSPLIRDLAN